MAALQPWPPLYMQSKILKAFVRQQQDQMEEFRRIEEHLRMLLMLAAWAKCTLHTFRRAISKKNW